MSNAISFESMAISAGLSCLVSALIGRGNPVTMAGIGALASLTHMCATRALEKLVDWNDMKVSEKTGCPYNIVKCLEAAGAIALAQGILRLAKGPTLNVPHTIILTLGVVFFSLSQPSSEKMNKKNISFITVV